MCLAFLNDYKDEEETRERQGSGRPRGRAINRFTMVPHSRGLRDTTTLSTIFLGGFNIDCRGGDTSAEGKVVGSLYSFRLVAPRSVASL